MAAGLKQNNIKPFDGVSWEDLYAIDAGASGNFFTRANLFVEVKQHSDGTTHAECLYLGTDAVDMSDLNSLPNGSILHAPAITAGTIFYKVSATVWKSGAVDTAVNT